MSDPEPQASSRETPEVDNRRTLRRPLMVLKVHREGGPDTLLGYAKNLSSGGMAVTTINGPEVGTRLRARFALPEPLGLQIRCQCEVVWVRPFARGSRSDPGVGLKFLELPRETAAAIDYWVRTDTDRRSVPRHRRPVVGGCRAA